MIDVDHIRVNVRMPDDEVRIVAMQPYIRLPPNPVEPYRWSEDAVNAQLAAISRTLDIALSGFGGPCANFILFPEYSVPGVDGATAINERISSNEWPNESIIIAGVHGLPKDEYANLCHVLAAHVSVANAPGSVLVGNWVNCCVIWVKDRDGLVQIWIQPKIRPALAEISVTCNDMFRGSKVYVFECEYERHNFPCRFTTLICFDWIASQAGDTLCDELLEKLTALQGRNETSLDWVFVVQYNEEPNHPSFLASTRRFLAERGWHPFILRDNAVMVNANTAVSPLPAGNGSYGFSACVFSPSAQFVTNSCRPTVCMQPKSRRGNDNLGTCKDVIFREMGECIHAFTVSVPRFVTQDPTGRTLPLPLAHVHPVCESNDPRLSGGPIPAAVKWVGDSLDHLERASANALAGCPLVRKAEAIEPGIIDAIRPSDGHAASDFVNWAACSFSSGIESRNGLRRLNADLWEADEADALKHVLHSLTSLGLAYPLEFDSVMLHGAVLHDERFVQIVAIRGDTHQDCRLHYDTHVPPQATDPVLVISRDRDNLSPTTEEYLRLDENAGERGLAFLDYQTLIDKCRNATDDNALKGYLDGILPRESRII